MNEQPWHLSLALVFASTLNFILCLVGIAVGAILSYMLIYNLLYILGVIVGFVLTPFGLIVVIAVCVFLLWRYRKPKAVQS